MGQILRNQIVGLLQRTSPSIVSLAPSVLNIGGQQYSTSTNLLMDITTSGFGGLDTGSVATSTTYHLYAVVNGGGAVGLVTSLNLPLAGGPVGFSSSKYLWSIHTDTSSLILNFRRDGKRNVFLDTENGILTTPDLTANPAALTIDSSGSGVFPINTNVASNSPTFTSGMLNGLADSFIGMMWIAFDGGGADAFFQFWETVSGNVSTIVNFWARQQNTGKIYQSQYAGQVGTSYTFAFASSPISITTREMHNQILSYENKLVDESSSAGTIVQNGTQIPGPRSEIFAQGGNGHGSTDTHIRRFANLVSIVGSDVTVTDNAVNGTYFRINSDGLYSIAYEDASASGAAAGLTKNSPFLTTPVSDVSNDPYRLISSSVSGAGTDQPAAITTTLFLSQGDIIRAHNDSASTPDGTANNGTTFRITKVANAPLATPIGPRSESWVQGGSGHGSGNTAIRIFTSSVINSGSDITYVPSPTNGDSWIINTDGIYSMDYSDSSSGSANRIGISINSSQLTTSIDGISSSTILIQGQTGASSASDYVGATKILHAGDVIRAHTNGSPDGTSVNRVSFRITKMNN